MKDTFLLFDLDGTLWNSSQQVADSWNIVLEKYNSASSLPRFTAQDICSVMGRTMTEIAQALLPGLPDEERAVLFKECEEYEIEYITSHSGVLYPDVEATLASLKKKGYKTAVVSNCQAGYVGAFLISSKLGKYFDDYEEWGRTGRPKAENIRLVMERNHFDKAVYIGDTNGDFDSSKKAGIPFVHAAYGFGEVSGADAVIHTFSDLLKLY